MAIQFNYSGNPYQLASGHRHKDHKLWFIGSVQNSEIRGKIVPAHIFVCGSREEVETRQRFTLVEIPKDVAEQGTDKSLSCKPEQFQSTEYPAYGRILYDPARKHEVAPIEAMLKQAGIPDRSHAPVQYRTLAQALEESKTPGA